MYHFFWQLWLVLRVKLMEINFRNLFSRYALLNSSNTFLSLRNVLLTFFYNSFAGKGFASILVLESFHKWAEQIRLTPEIQAKRPSKENVSTYKFLLLTHHEFADICPSLKLQKSGSKCCSLARSKPPEWQIPFPL